MREFSDQEFMDFLDSVEDPVNIFGLTFSPSEIVRKLDPIAFRVMKSDYISLMEEEADFDEYCTDLVEY